MCCEGDLLVGVPDASAGRKTSCTLVSKFYLLFLSAVSLVEVTARGRQLAAKTSKRSLAVKRRKSSSSSSLVGSMQSIVSYSLFSTGVYANLHIVPAESDWTLFSNTGSTTPASKITGDETADPSESTFLAPAYHVTPGAPASSLAPGPPASSLVSEPPASTPAPTTSTPPLMPGPPPSLVLKPPGSSLAPRPSSPLNRANSACWPATTQLVATPDTPDSVQDRVTPAASVMDFVNSYTVNELQLSTPVHPHPQVNATPLDLSQRHGTIQNKDCSPSFNLNPLANITDEPAWMKKKQTLAYFRRTVKLGCLPNVIGHWYELERLLGFQEVVSFCEYFTLCVVLTISRPHQGSRYPHVHQ